MFHAAVGSDDAGPGYLPAQAWRDRKVAAEAAYDLPAYRELLFLYAVARDFAQKADDSSSVDLLLPMDTDAPSAPVSRLVASMPSILERRTPGTAGAGAFKRDGDAAPASGAPAAAEADPAPAKADSGLSLDLGPLDLQEDPVKPGKIIRR